MKYLFAFAVFVALVGVGCGSLVNHAQYHVLPPGFQTKAATVPAGEREAVKQILESVAEEFRLEDRTKTSLIPDVIGA